MTEQEIFEFYELYEPSITKIGESGKWHLFTFATQDCNIKFNSYGEAFRYAYDFIKDGHWEPGETWWNRYVKNAEKEDVPPFDYWVPDEEFEIYMCNFVNTIKKLMIKSD